MTLPNKLPKDPLYKTYEMTEADWKEYFECRKKYDVEYTKEQRTECCNRAGKLFAEGKKEDADKIIVMEDGKINGIGTHDELLKSNKIYKEVYDSQMKGSEV